MAHETIHFPMENAAYESANDQLSSQAKGQNSLAIMATLVFDRESSTQERHEQILVGMDATLPVYYSGQITSDEKHSD